MLENHQRSDAAPAAGLSVLELPGGAAGSYCARVLADLGATVTRLDDPAAPNEQDLNYAQYLEAGKASAIGDAWAALAVTSDVVVHDRCLPVAAPGGAPGRAWCGDHPGVVWLDISPFGTTGPWAEVPATPFTILAASGALLLEPSGRLQREYYPGRPPVRWGGHAAEHVVGMQGAAMVLAALVDRERSARGQFIEVSAQEALMHVVRHDLDRFQRDGRVRERSGAPGANRELVSGTMRCRDGYVALWPLEPYMIENLSTAMGERGFGHHAWFYDEHGRHAHANEMRPAIEAWVGEQTRAELRKFGLEQRIAVMPVYEPGELPDRPQLISRRFFRSLSTGTGSEVPLAGLPFPTPSPPPVTDAAAAFSPAPAPGQGPLAGMRVVELAHWQAGPAAGMVAALLGAEVIRIESEDRPDMYRRYGDTLDESFMFSEFNANKQSVRLNLKHPEGRALARRLIVEQSHAVISNMRLGALAGLGLDWPSLAEERPDLVYVLISNAGTSGPEKDQLGYATTFVAGGGLAALTGYADGPPAELVAWPDTVVGLWAALALAAGGCRRARTGAGGFFDVAGQEAIAALVGDAVLAAAQGTPVRRDGNRDEDHRPHDCYPCLGFDEWVAIAVTDDATWRRLAGLLPAWASHESLATKAGRCKLGNEIDKQLANWTRTRTASDVTEQLHAAGVPAAPVFGADALVVHPHVNARDCFVTVEHPFVGLLHTVGLPWRFERTPGAAPAAAPWLGQHDLDVLVRLLGCSEDEVAELQRTGANR